jgi:hypothetical protein
LDKKVNGIGRLKYHGKDVKDGKHDKDDRYLKQKKEGAAWKKWDSNPRYRNFL